MGYEKKEAQIKRGCLQSPSPDSKAFGYTLVFARYPHGEYLATILGAMNLSIFPREIGTEDKPHASSLLRNKIIHRQTELSSTGMLTSEPVAWLQQKTQSAGLWDKSLAQEYVLDCFKDFLPECSMDFLVSRCKDTTIKYSMQESKGNINSVCIHGNRNYVN